MMNLNPIPIKRLTKTSRLPYRGSKGAAGYDLFADRPSIEEEVNIEAFSNGTWFIDPYKTVLIPTGIAIAIPQGFFGAIYPRSGLATRMGLRLANSVGVIDEDYRGEIKIPIYNDSDSLQSIDYGDRIAQIIFQPYLCSPFEEKEELDDTDRGAGGFGSTGKE